MSNFNKSPFLMPKININRTPSSFSKDNWVEKGFERSYWNHKKTSYSEVTKNSWEIAVGYTYSNGHPLSADPSQTKFEMFPEYYKLTVKNGYAFIIDYQSSQLTTNWYTNHRFENDKFFHEYSSGDMALKDGSLEIAGDNENINITGKDSNINVADGDINIEGDNKNLNIIGKNSGISVAEGDAKITKGNINVEDGDINITEGDAKITKGNINVEDGDINITEGDAKITKGNINVEDGNLTVKGDTILGNSSSNSATVNGSLKLSNLSTGSSNSVLIETNGILQKRNANSRIWNVNAGFLTNDTNPIINALQKYTGPGKLESSNIIDDGNTVNITGDVSVTGKILSNGADIVNLLNASVSSLSANFTGSLSATEINTVNSSTINLNWDPTSKTLSADFTGSLSATEINTVNSSTINLNWDPTSKTLSANFIGTLSGSISGGGLTSVVGIAPIYISNSTTMPVISVNLSSYDNKIKQLSAAIIEIESTGGVEVGGNLTPTIEKGFIKQFAKMKPSNQNIAAITTTNRVIAWGYANGGESSTGGKLAPSFATSNRVPPSHYCRVPFYSNWTVNGGSEGGDYLDENPNIKIVDLFWNNYGAMALLDDGTAWIAGINQGDLGVGSAPADSSFAPTCGFVKLSFGTGTQPFIKRVDCASDNNSNAAVFTALDSTDTLWVWGNTKDGLFGTAHSTLIENLSLPKKMGSMSIINFTAANVYSTSNVDFENQILDYEINATETNGTTMSIILKNNSLYISGDNSYGQRGTGFTTSSGLFNHAKKNSTDYVNDAVKVEKGSYAGRQLHFYINSVGVVFGAGDNSTYGLGNNSTTDSSFFTSSTWPAGVIAHKIFTSGYYFPCIFAQCTDSSGNNCLYSWGYNGSTGHCGVNSTANYITIPTVCIVRASNGSKIPLIDVENVFISDQVGRNSGVTEPGNWGAVCVVDSSNYAYTCGYSNYNDPPQYSNNNAQFFVKVSLKNVKEVLMGGDVNRHRWNAFLLKNGSVWGMGDVSNYVFGVGVDTIKHPCRIL